MDVKVEHQREKVIFSIGVTAGFVSLIKDLKLDKSILDLQEQCFVSVKEIINQITNEGTCSVSSIREYSSLVLDLYNSINETGRSVFYSYKRKKDIDIFEQIENAHNAIMVLKSV